jgi:GH25 family lysozyme M1 (1,4-beta-N-acetylmuramidase)
MAQRPLGIDVSSYQGSSDNPPTNVIWTNVKSAGISFAWAKATEGTDYIDANFAYNEVNAKAAGVLIGAYHFAHPEEHLGLAGADTEAAYFWNEIKQYITADGTCMMPMLDYETSPGSSYTKATSSQWVNEWCQDLVNYGASNGIVINPVIYTYTSFANTWLNSSVTNWPLWMAASLNGQTAQTGAPPTSPWSTWAFWQYGQGSVSGVEGAVDEDVFNGTASTLSNYVINGPFSSTTITLNALTPSTYGQSVLFTATVAPTPSGGTVQFYDNGAALGGPLDASGGTVTYFTSLLSAGSYPVTASYSGGMGYGPSSTAGPLIQQINPAPLSITASPQRKMYGTLLTFGSGSAEFASSGLQNEETIGTVTLAVSGNGGAANAPVGTYTITPSLATGGTFTAANYNITYNTGPLTVTLPPNTIPVTIISISGPGNGTVQLNFTGTPGYVYLIEAAANLTQPITWTILSTNAADANGLFNFIDVNAASYPDRYYRTAIQ